MPSTSARLATPRQRSFIASLVRERGGVESLRDPLATSVVLAANGTLTANDASRAIETLLAMPRTAPAASAQDGTSVPRPSPDTRPGRMLLAGGIEATATLADGQHVTVTIRTRKRSGRGWTNAALGEEGSRTNVSILGRKVGWINVGADGGLLLTLRTRRQEFVGAVRAVFAVAAGLQPQFGVNRVQEASRCGRCFRTLTDPVSIDRGIGPECFGRDTGSQHVAAERAANGGQDVRPEPTTGRTTSIGVSPVRTVSDLANEAARRRAGVEHPDVVEARMHAQFAEAEQVAERAAYEAEMEQDRQMQALETVADALSIPVAPAGFVPERRPSADVSRARDLIAEALDSYFGEPELSFALRIFDQLAGR
jgi:hypothetical protein